MAAPTERKTPVTEQVDSIRPVEPHRYVRPDGLSDRIGNAVVRWLTAHGVSLRGSRVLTVAGRRSGLPRSTPVNLLTHDGERYLVAPRGRTEWVRNVRAADGAAELALGRRVEQVTLVEVPVADRTPVIRAYVDAWYWEVGRFVEGLTRDSSDAEILAVAPGMPVFRITPAD
jgi:deazaflavin-dependent oxidoreductase (nitroreductase family)